MLNVIIKTEGHVIVDSFKVNNWSEAFKVVDNYFCPTGIQEVIIRKIKNK